MLAHGYLSFLGHWEHLFSMSHMWVLLHILHSIILYLSLSLPSRYTFLEDKYMLHIFFENYDQPRQSIKKQSRYFTNKVCLVEAMVFPVVVYGCESWTIKKAEHRRIDAFELWCWRRLLRVPCTARRSNLSILNEINPACSMERLMLKLKLQYFGHLMRRADSFERAWCWKRLKAGKKGDDRGWDGWMASPTQWTWVWVDSGSWWWKGRLGVLQFVGLQRVGHDWVTELNWTAAA